MSRVADIEIKAACSPEDLEKALRVSALALSKERESRAKDEFRELNPASRRLVSFVDESYRIMCDSLADQIRKVLAEG